MQFLEIKTFNDLSSFLGMKPKNLGYMLYKLPRNNLYESFLIDKRDGSKRKINAPKVQLKKIQKKIKYELEKIYKPHKSTMGFVKNRSIVTNAKLHINKKWIVNIDIKDFFNTITPKRVYGLFKAKPFSFNDKIASILANIVTFKNSLPQGAVTSPIISNMISFRLDRHLERYCFRKDIVYTRYVDDITFSGDESFKLNFVYNDINNKVNDKVVDIIENNGFKINQNKIRCNFYFQHQDVTGLKVNKKTNIKSFFKYQTRAMLHAWEKFDLANATKDFIEKNKIKYKVKNKEKLFIQTLQGRISYIGMVLGKENKFYNQVALSYNKLSKTNTFKVTYNVDDVHEFATFSFFKYELGSQTLETVSVAFHSYGKFYMCLHGIQDLQFLEDLGNKEDIIKYVEQILKNSEIDNLRYKDEIKLNKAIVLDLSLKKDLLIFKVPNMFIPYSYKISTKIPDRRNNYTINYIDDSRNYEQIDTRLGNKRIYKSCYGYPLNVEVGQGWSGSPVVKKGTNMVVGYIAYGFDGSTKSTKFKNGMFDFQDIDIE